MSGPLRLPIRIDKNGPLRLLIDKNGHYLPWLVTDVMHNKKSKSFGSGAKKHIRAIQVQVYSSISTNIFKYINQYILTNN